MTAGVIGYGLASLVAAQSPAAFALAANRPAVLARPALREPGHSWHVTIKVGPFVPIMNCHD
jgi:hypothetical protein